MYKSVGERVQFSDTMVMIHTLGDDAKRISRGRSY